MARRRYEDFKNVDWTLDGDETDRNAVSEVEQAILAVLMDIRGELRAIRGVVTCVNAIRIPHILDAIEANTKKPRKKRKARVLRAA